MTPPEEIRIGPEVRVTHFTPDYDAIRAFVACEAGADLGVLERLADAVLSGGTVHPTVQKIANMIIAQAVLRGVLPGKKIGRKKADAFKGHEVAYMFLELTDAGTSREDALEAVNRKFGVVERHIDRLVKQYRPMIGWFFEDRERYRAWRRTCDETGYESYEATVRMDLNIREHLPAVNTTPSQEELLDKVQVLLEQIRVEWSADIKPASIVVRDSMPP